MNAYTTTIAGYIDGNGVVKVFAMFDLHKIYQTIGFQRTQRHRQHPLGNIADRLLNFVEAHCSVDVQRFQYQ
jgi:hypothetical protein